MPATADGVIPQASSGAASTRTTDPTFVLVSPCGGNLGDAAIQDGMIQGIRARFPNAVIYGITSNPADTMERHRIPSYPIAGFCRAGYAVVPLPGESLPAHPRPVREGPGFRRCAGTSLARMLARAARWMLPRGWPWMIRAEITHTIGAFKFLRGVDILCISGGGQLMDTWGGPWGHPYALLKWTVLARLRGAKPVFLSVGFSGLDSRLSRLLTRTALSLAAYRSYRDSGSRELMRRAGFRRDDPVYPDLAYSYPLGGPSQARDRDLGCVVGLSPISYYHPRLWCRKDAGVYQAYLRDLATIAQWLLARGYRVSIFSSGPIDRFAVADLWDKLATETSPTVMERVELHDTTTVPDFLERAAAVDLMVASRLHSVLLSQLAGTPVIALSFDRKVDVQMEAVGQSSFCLDIDRLELSEFQACFHRLEASLEAARQQIRARFADYRSQVENQYDAVLLPESRS